MKRVRYVLEIFVHPWKYYYVTMPWDFLEEACWIFDGSSRFNKKTQRKMGINCWSANLIGVVLLPQDFGSEAIFLVNMNIFKGFDFLLSFLDADLLEKPPHQTTNRRPLTQSILRFGIWIHPPSTHRFFLRTCFAIKFHEFVFGWKGYDMSFVGQKITAHCEKMLMIFC